MTEVVPTAEFASVVYGSGGVALDDPAEAFHEASRLYPNIAPGRIETLVALARSPGLQQSAARAGRTHGHRPGVDLPRGALPQRTSFGAVLEARRSSSAHVPRPLPLPDLAAVLEAGYASRPIAAGTQRRSVPSGGALYPLELYVLALRVSEVEASTLHYDPFRHRLEALGPLDADEVRSALVDPSLVEPAAALVVITAMFWRSRFKYGLRGYRFALLEAGHVVQNAVLAAAAIGLHALPLGGFYDRRLDRLVGADGLDEAAVYALLLGAGS
jgi:SagB-type dehydrogenase family enzyme